ncbi:MAG: enoyl-CoA hydratase/isomerase family protein [Alphaproteobacteria bacterium]|nr:enoyl-CoA hydratase/isomerase family protein [Alphaproteobacteria bacterium]
MTNDTDLIISRVDGRTGRLIINRPKALNALSKEMCAIMNDRLIAWAADRAIDRVVITASEGRAFCAGGDVRSINALILEDVRHADDYFRVEYITHSILDTYPKPVISLADGLTMGAGAGVLLHASHPVITDAMDFAMPETAIGLFPDVAASIFLRRAPAAAGLMMGMTGWRIGGGDMLALGITDRGVASADADRLCDAIVALDDNAGLDDLLDSYSREMPDTPVVVALDWINGHFSKASPAAIRSSLEGDDHAMAEKLRLALDTRSPLSIAVTHELLTNEAHHSASIREAIQLDYALACRICRYPDFIEGVRALLIDKDNAPSWMHRRLDDVAAETIAAIFAEDDRPRFDLPADYIPLMTTRVRLRYTPCC